MVRQLAKLSPRRVATLSKPGRHSDGGGLYLVVEPSGSKRWAFLFRWKRPGEIGAGRLREMGLGSFNSVSLEKARKKAAHARDLLDDGLDPIEARKAERPAPSFGEVADELIRIRSTELRNEKSKARWKRALVTYAASLRTIPVDAITTEHVLAALNAPPADDPKGEPLWLRVPESAKLARGYIEAVLDAAKAKGFRAGENPARWRGHLDHLLSRPKKLLRGHHAAMAFHDTPAFVQELRMRQAVSALALEFLILTAARSGEVFGATWSEIDLGEKVWTIPASRMKAEREHRVPLSARAIEILEKAQPLKRGHAPHVFPGPGDKDRPLSTMALAMLMRRMERGEFTVHGFRSAFRDWAGEATNFPREVAEAALAHVIGDSAERAYRRGDALEKRRKLMEAWASYCARQPNNVSPFSRMQGAA